MYSQRNVHTFKIFLEIIWQQFHLELLPFHKHFTSNLSEFVFINIDIFLFLWQRWSSLIIDSYTCRRVQFLTWCQAQKCNNLLLLKIYTDQICNFSIRSAYLCRYFVYRWRDIIYQKLINLCKYLFLWNIHK